MKKIRLLLIEDNPILRDGILSILKPYKDINVINNPGNSRNTLLNLSQIKPNVVLLDMGLRSQNSLRVVEVLKKEFREAKIIVMDLAPVQADILKYVEAGANGFILKDASLNDLLQTIRTVSQGSTVLPTPLINSLFSQIVEHALGTGRLKLRNALRMTKREKEVIRFLSEGLTNKEIAEKIHVSAFTVKSHIHNIMEKLALHTRLEVAHYSYTGETLKAISKTVSTMND